MGNAGDEALLLSLLQMLPKSVEPIVLSGNPQATQKSYEVSSCDRKSTFALLDALRVSDIFIWGGGSLMQDATSLASPVYYAGLMALAQQRGLKTIAWAQGIGPLNRSLTRWLTKQVLLGCSGISVRDTASAELLHRWQIDPVVAPDPVWALTSEAPPLYPDTDKPIVAVILRLHRLLTPSRLEVLIRAIQSFQAQSDAFILLVPFQPKQDRDLALRIAATLEVNYTTVEIFNPKQLKGLFDRVKLTIAMRLHGLIMAAASGCNCFALSYDPKVSQLMSELDLPGYELESLPNDPEIIAQDWLDSLAGQSIPTAEIQSLIDRAGIHQQLLTEVIINH